MAREGVRRATASGRSGVVDDRDDGTFLSRDGYIVDFLGDRWRLNKDTDLPVGKLCKIFPGDSHALRLVLAFFAKHSSSHHVQNLMWRFLHYVKALDGAEPFSTESILSYRASLPKSRGWYLSPVRILISKWARLGYAGVPPETLKLLDSITIKGNEKGRSVQSQNPEDGPLTAVEMQGITEATNYLFANDMLSLADTALFMVVAMSGRRPAQVAALKLKDLVASGDKRFIRFPRAKQRHMGWRSSFSKYAIVEDLWLLLNAQAQAVKTRFLIELNDQTVSRQMLEELPLFPNPKEDLSLALDPQVLISDRLHMPTASVGSSIVKTGRQLNVFSERTGQPLRLSSTRFRYTLGTNLAKEGMGVYVIAAALDHSDTQNAGVYVKSLPDIVGRIDRAVAMELAPYAQAFKGLVIPSEKHALRGGDPSSRVSNGSEKLGNCGSYGFCGALAPVACYTCPHFQPWVDGPHEEVLDGLIAERERVKQLTGDMTIASANDRLIYAVGEVIHRCRVAKGVSS
tara:strand:+ start:221 stop:1765 length:1545 start_codon:yes stop_codon:yes gene_type:complete